MISADAPLPPTRSLGRSNDDREDAEGDGDNVERDPPAPSLEAVHRQVRREIHNAPVAAAALPAPQPPAAPVRLADNNPAALGWVKGPEGVAPAPEPKAGQPEKTVVAAPPASALPARNADNKPATLGWVKGPDGVAQAPEPKAAAPTKAIAAVLPPPAPARAADLKANPPKAVVAAAHSREETRIARSEDVRPSGHDGWVIQIGASDDAGKANDLPPALVGENREWVKQKAEDQERAAGSSCSLNEAFHGRRMEAFHDIIPKSIAAR